MSLLHPGPDLTRRPPPPTSSRPAAREGRGLPQRARSEVMKAPNSMHLCFWGAVSWAQQKRAPLKDSFVSENRPSHGVK